MPPYGYMRKSTVRNLATDLGPETQEREIRGLAKRHGDNGPALVMLADWDVSGTGKFTTKRHAYQQLLEAIRSGACTAVYSYSLSRLGRSVHELSGLFDLCRARGVPVRLVADSFDTSTPSGMAMAGMLAVFAQFEADVASERAKAAQATRRARGERVGPRLYGEAEGETLQAVLDAFHEAGSYHGAAKLLNERGVPTRHGRRGWWASTVGKMVGRVEPSSKPGRARAKAAPSFILSRLLVCPFCGTRLTGANARAGHPAISYSCSRGAQLPHGRRSINEPAILPAIRAEVAHLVTPDMLEAGSDDTRQRAELEQRRARVLDMYEAGDIDRDEKSRRVESIDQTAASLDSRRIVMAIPNLDWDWPPRQINAVLRALFERIELDPETFQPVAFEWTVPAWRAEAEASAVA